MKRIRIETGLMFPFAILLIILKAFGVISAPWWIVLLPVWSTLLFLAIAACMALSLLNQLQSTKKALAGFVKDNHKMDLTKEITPGRIVEFFPNGQSPALPNNMTTAPAMAVQCFGERTNFNVFTAGASPVLTAWSIRHKSDASEGEAYWDWFPIK